MEEQKLVEIANRRRTRQRLESSASKSDIERQTKLVSSIVKILHQSLRKKINTERKSAMNTQDDSQDEIRKSHSTRPPKKSVFSKTARMTAPSNVLKRQLSDENFSRRLSKRVTISAHLCATNCILHGKKVYSAAATKQPCWKYLKLYKMSPNTMRNRSGAFLLSGTWDETRSGCFDIIKHRIYIR